MKQNKNSRLMPFLMALCVVIGILIGTFYANHFSGNRLNIINSGSNRLNNLLHIIDDQYVDAVNLDSLVDKAIPQILSDLDPHSVYISAKDVQQATDDLKVCHPRRHHPHPGHHQRRSCRTCGIAGRRQNSQC